MKHRLAATVKEALEALRAVPNDGDRMTHAQQHRLHHLHVELVVLRDQDIGGLHFRLPHVEGVLRKHLFLDHLDIRFRIGALDLEREREV